MIHFLNGFTIGCNTEPQISDDGSLASPSTEWLYKNNNLVWLYFVRTYWSHGSMIPKINPSNSCFRPTSSNNDYSIYYDKSTGSRAIVTATEDGLYLGTTLDFHDGDFTFRIPKYPIYQWSNIQSSIPTSGRFQYPMSLFIGKINGKLDIMFGFDNQADYMQWKLSQ